MPSVTIEYNLRSTENFCLDSQCFIKFFSLYFFANNTWHYFHVLIKNVLMYICFLPPAPLFKPKGRTLLPQLTAIWRLSRFIATCCRWYLNWNSYLKGIIHPCWVKLLWRVREKAKRLPWLKREAAVGVDLTLQKYNGFFGGLSFYFYASPSVIIILKIILIYFKSISQASMKIRHLQKCFLV